MAVIPDPRIWVCDSMAYRLREEFISPATTEALASYQDAFRKRIHWKMKHYGNLYTQLHRRDVNKAIDEVRNVD